MVASGGDTMQREYEPLIREFVDLLLARFGDRVVSVLVFGSVARGAARADSDIDVCLVMRDLPSSRYQRHQLLAPVLAALRSGRTYCDAIQRGYSPDFSVLLYTPDEVRDTKPIFLDLVEDAVFVLDDGTMKTKLESLRRRLRELGSRKVTLSDGTYYWLLKPDLRLGEVIEL